MGARVKVDRELKICKGACRKPRTPMNIQMPNRSMSRKAKAMGKPEASSSTKPPMNRVSTAHHSMI